MTGTVIPQREHRRVSAIVAGLIALAVVVVAVYFGFAKQLPFTHSYQLKAVFERANSIRLGSPVRTAGVNVGKVVKVSRQPNSDAAVLVMDIQSKGLPIHRDATLKIRPRIFFEGNFFVDLKPGTPSAPTLKSGATVPITQTATPVQLDEVLTSLQADSRQDLRDVLDAYGTGLTHRPTAAEDVGQDPAVQGETAAEALNDSYTYSGEALQNTALINQALLGTEASDLSKLVSGLGRVSTILNANETELEELITNLNLTLAATASQASNLRRSVARLGPTIKDANSALTALNDAFPSTRALALELTPGIEQIPATIEAADPFIPQARLLLGDSSLGGVAKQLRAAAPSLASLVNQGVDLFRQVSLLSRCASDVVLPTANVALEDGDLSSGVENYKEFLYGLVGQSGESENFDGNGQYLRLNSGGGSQAVKTGKIPNRASGSDRLFGNAVLPPLGTRPRWPNKLPPFKTSTPCYESKRPDLNGPLADAGPPSPAPTETTP